MQGGGETRSLRRFHRNAAAAPTLLSQEAVSFNGINADVIAECIDIKQLLLASVRPKTQPAGPVSTLGRSGVRGDSNAGRLRKRDVESRSVEISSFEASFLHNIVLKVIHFTANLPPPSCQM